MSLDILEPSIFSKHVSEWMDHTIQGQNPFTKTPAECEEIYGLAYALYKNKQYQDASHFFRLLLMGQPNEIKYWKGLGASLQMQKFYDEALDCYACIQWSNPKKCDAYFYLQVADCYFALRKVELGLRSLHAAQKIAKQRKDKKVLQHVAFMQERWSSERPKEK
jgi:secretion system chaperone SscA